MIEYLKQLKARVMNKIYIQVTNRAMKGCRVCRALVLYQWNRRAPLNIPTKDA